MVLTTTFRSLANVLPAGWTVDAPNQFPAIGSHTWDESGVPWLTMPGNGVNYDSYFGSSVNDNTYGFRHDLASHAGGEQRIVFALKGEYSYRKSFGINIVVEGASTAEVARFSVQHPNNDAYPPSAYAFARSGGTNTTLQNRSNFDDYMSGSPRFLMWWYEGSATGIHHFYTSANGYEWEEATNPGARPFTGLTIKIGTHSASPGSGGSIGVVGCWDILAFGSQDVRQPYTSEYTLEPVSVIDGASGSLPANWTDESVPGTGGAAGVSWTGSAMRLTSRPAINPELNGARLRYTGAGLAKWYIYQAARCPNSNSQIYMTTGATTEAFGAWRDQYIPGPGQGLGLEQNLHSTIRRPIFTKKKELGNVAGGVGSTFLDEIYYNHLETDGVGVANFRDNVLFHRLLTYDGLRFRVWEWTGARGDMPTDPNVYDGEEVTLEDFDDFRPYITLSQNQNPSNLGADGNVDIETFEWGSLVEEVPPVTSVDIDWSGDDAAKFTAVTFTVDGAHAQALSEVGGKGVIDGTAGAATGVSNLRQAFVLADTDEWGDFHIRIPIVSGKFDGATKPQHGVIGRYQEDGGKRRAIVIWHDAAFGIIHIINVGVWSSNLDGTGFLNRQGNLWMALGKTYTASAVTRSGGVITAIIPTGVEDLIAGDRLSVDVAGTSQPLDVIQVPVLSASGTTVTLDAPGPDSLTPMAASLSRLTPYTLDVECKGPVVRARAWDRVQSIPEWTDATRALTINLDTDAAGNSTLRAANPTPFGQGGVGIVGAHVGNNDTGQAIYGPGTFDDMSQGWPPLSLLSEGNALFGPGAVKRGVLGLLTEGDSARALSPVKRRMLTLLAEGDAAPILTAVKAGSLPRLTESEAVAALALGVKSRLLQQLVEGDAVQVLTNPIGPPPSPSVHSISRLLRGYRIGRLRQ